MTRFIDKDAETTALEVMRRYTGAHNNLDIEVFVETFNFPLFDMSGKNGTISIIPLFQKLCRFIPLLLVGPPLSFHSFLLQLLDLIQIHQISLLFLLKMALEHQLRLHCLLCQIT